MATYKEIKGVTVQTQDSDPVEFVGSWSSGGNLNAGRRGIAGAGTQTAALAAGGGPATVPASTDQAEEYNGTSWTEVNEINTARRLFMGMGTQTSAIVTGGYNPPGATGVTESYDGTNFTEVADLNTARYANA